MKRHAALAALLALACGYDFDRYAAPSERAADGGDSGELASGGSADQGGAGAGGTASGGKGGTASGGKGGAAGKGGSGGTASGGKGGTAGAGDSGQAGDGGEPAAASGGTGGSSGTAGSAGTGGSGEFDCAALGGTIFDGHCYFAVGSGAGLPFTDAAAACAASDGATLVAITSAEEQSALAAAFFPSTNDFWIGLSLDGAPDDMPIECVLFHEVCPFEWSSGEELAFTNWAVRDGDDEPNYSGACVRIQAADLSWADFGCASALPAICER